MTDQNRPKPPQPAQQQAVPGVTEQMDPKPDHGPGPFSSAVAAWA